VPKGGCKSRCPEGEAVRGLQFPEVDQLEESIRSRKIGENLPGGREKPDGKKQSSGVTDSLGGRSSRVSDKTF